MNDDFTSQTAEVARTHFSGTIWFSAAVIGSALPLTGLLASGWRPGDLVGGDQVLWWIGAVIVVLAIAALAYAGCPVLGIPIEREDRYKDLAVQGGLLLFGLGSILTMLAVLLSPA